MGNIAKKALRVGEPSARDKYTALHSLREAGWFALYHKLLEASGWNTVVTPRKAMFADLPSHRALRTITVQTWSNDE
jgi:hypothetical protein